MINNINIPFGNTIITHKNASLNTSLKLSINQSRYSKRRINWINDTKINKFQLKYLIFVSILLFSLIMTKAYAQGIGPDGNFDENILGWHCGSVNPTWISDDGSNDSGNGSLQISREKFVSTGGRLGGGACDWIIVTAQTDYKFEGYYKLPTDSQFDNVLIELYWYTEDEIFISVDSLVIPTSSIMRDEWIKFEKESTSPIEGEKLAISLAFQFYPSGNDVISAFLLWDDLHVINNTNNIFFSGFE